MDIIYQFILPLSILYSICITIYSIIISIYCSKHINKIDNYNNRIKDLLEDRIYKLKYANNLLNNNDFKTKEYYKRIGAINCMKLIIKEIEKWK